MFKTRTFAGVMAATVAALGAGASAHEGAVPRGVPHLDHVFVIMMENHGFGQIVNNPNESYLNGLIASKAVAYATNYYGVGHPASRIILKSWAVPISACAATTIPCGTAAAASTT